MSDLATLMDTDPLKFSKDRTEVREIIKFYRDKRHLYNLGDLKAGTVKTRAKPVASDIADLLGDIKVNL